MRRKGVILDDPISSDSDCDSAFKPKPKPNPKRRKPLSSTIPPSSSNLIVLSSSSDSENGQENEKTSLGGKKIVSPFSIAKESRKRRRKDRNARKEVACPRCTYLNFISASKCAMCDGAMKPKSASTTSSSSSRARASSPDVVKSRSPLSKKRSPRNMAGPTSFTDFKEGKGNVDVKGKKRKTVKRPQVVKIRGGMRKKRGGSLEEVKREEKRESPGSWLDLHAPEDEAGLFRALNKKKVLEMKDWLSRSSATKRVLILHGPSGSGKTTCIKVLAKCHGCTVRRWSSEQQRGATFSRNVSQGDTTNRHDLHVPYVSEVKDFEEFLYFSKYPQLSVVSKQQTNHLTLVKDLPALHSPDVKTALHEVFARVVNSRSTNKVALLYTSPSESTNPKEMAELFSDYVLSHPATTVVGIREVPVLRLKRVLQHIGEREGLNLGKERYKEIAEDSQGDMRCAIQSLQFKGKANRAQSFASQTNSKRDLMFSMNHSVGKLIRGKRVSEEADAKLNYDPEIVAEASALAPDALTMFLDYHFVEYFSDVEDMYNVYDSLSLTDVWSKSGSVRGASTYRKRDKLFPHAYVLSVGSRSVATYNRHLIKNGFVRITKPRMYSVTSRARERRHLVDTQLASAVLGSSDFVLNEIAPWLSMFPSVDGIDLSVLDNLSFQTSARTQKKPVAPRPRQEAGEDETKEVLKDDDIME